MVWYGLGLVAILALCQHAAPAFVPAPSRVPAIQSEQMTDNLKVTAVSAGLALLAPAEAMAKEGKWGALEGKASSLVHPIIMGVLFLATLYTGFLGWQWRQTRLVGVELADLRKTLPDEDPEKEPSSAAKAIKAQIAELTQQRTDLVSGKFKDRHHQISALLLASGVFFTTYGVCNTWFRTEKLFPGPHLFAGAAICVGWVLASALVPWMEKGNEAARNAHIALNVIILGLFAWQLPTGWEILMKVWGNAKLAWF